MVTGSTIPLEVFYEYGAHSDSFFDWVPANTYGQRFLALRQAHPKHGLSQTETRKSAFLGHRESVPAQKLSQLAAGLPQK